MKVTSPLAAYLLLEEDSYVDHITMQRVEVNELVVMASACARIFVRKRSSLVLLMFSRT